MLNEISLRNCFKNASAGQLAAVILIELTCPTVAWTTLTFALVSDLPSDLGQLTRRTWAPVERAGVAQEARNAHYPFGFF